MSSVAGNALARLTALPQEAARITRDAPWSIEAEKPPRALAGTLLEALLLCFARAELRHHGGAPARHRKIVPRFGQLLARGANRRVATAILLDARRGGSGGDKVVKRPSETFKSCRKARTLIRRQLELHVKPSNPKTLAISVLFSPTGYRFASTRWRRPAQSPAASD